MLPLFDMQSTINSGFLFLWLWSYYKIPISRIAVIEIWKYFIANTHYASLYIL